MYLQFSDLSISKLAFSIQNLESRHQIILNSVDKVKYHNFAFYLTTTKKFGNRQKRKLCKENSRLPTFLFFVHSNLRSHKPIFSSKADYICSFFNLLLFIHTFFYYLILSYACANMETH